MNATQIIIIVVALLVIKLIQVLMKMKYQKQTPLSAIFGRFAKLAMLFKGSGIKIDENAHLSEEELRKYSLGNLYAYQQQGTLNTFSTGVGASVREIILGEYFGIKDRDSAVECLQWLVQAPSQMTFQYAFAALQEGGGKASQDWIYANEELKEHTRLPRRMSVEARKARRTPCRYYQRRCGGFRRRNRSLGCAGVGCGTAEFYRSPVLRAEVHFRIRMYGVYQCRLRND